MTAFQVSMLSAVAYAVLMLVASVSVGPVGLPDILLVLLPYQLLAAVLIALLTVKLGSWAKAGFCGIQWRGIVWMIPAWVVLAAMYLNIAAQTNGPLLPALGPVGWALVLGVPFLIAISEETLFRGVILRHAMAHTSLTRAMLLSAVLFALSHIAGAAFGHGLAGTAQHVMFSFLVGLFLAPIAIRIGNLWPLIIWHWLWNIAVFISQAADVLHPMILIGVAIQATISGWLWRDLEGR